MNKVEIQEAMLVALDKSGNNIEQQEKKEICEKLNFTNVKTINCVIDAERGNAIDLETGCVYHIIQRNYWGIVSQEEAKNIRNSEDGTLFVYRYNIKDMKDISMLYQMLLRSRAQKKYQEYLESMNKEKVKTITYPNKKTEK